jgi:hypothetical protein
MLEGTAKIGHGYGTFDSNLDTEAVRDQEEGGTRTLPSQNSAQLNISHGMLQDCYCCRAMWLTKHSTTLMNATMHQNASHLRMRRLWLQLWNGRGIL